MRETENMKKNLNKIILTKNITTIDARPSKRVTLSQAINEKNQE